MRIFTYILILLVFISISCVYLFRTKMPADRGLHVCVNHSQINKLLNNERLSAYRTYLNDVYSHTGVLYDDNNTHNTSLIPGIISGQSVYTIQGVITDQIEIRLEDQRFGDHTSKIVLYILRMKNLSTISDVSEIDNILPPGDSTREFEKLYMSGSTFIMKYIYNSKANLQYVIYRVNKKFDPSVKIINTNIDIPPAPCDIPTNMIEIAKYNCWIKSVVTTKLVDEWGTPFTIRKKGDYLEIISAGPDKQMNTHDDIREIRKIL